jgi:hypothetical protein
MPGLTNISTCYKTLRVFGAQNITVFDSTQGTTGNPILFTCKAGNAAVNYFLSNTEYCKDTTKCLIFCLILPKLCLITISFFSILGAPSEGSKRCDLLYPN